MTNSTNWAHIADLYDTYVQADFDLPFFLSEASKSTGDVLELMSGTGRVSIPLIRAGVRLTCVDASPEMLALLREKLERHNLTAPVHQMDVRELALDKKFDLVFIPFHSFAELLSPSDQRETLGRVFEHLTDGGRFICTLHNPRVRLKSVDGQLRLWGKYPLENQQGTLLFWGLENHDAAMSLVNGLELFEEYDAKGVLQSKRVIELRYRVIGKDEFETLASCAGFKVAVLYGDYAYAEFHEETSPFMIWVLRKT